MNSFARYMPNGRPGFILQSIATEFGVEIYSEHELDYYYSEEGRDEPTPCCLPLDPPTNEEIVVMRAEWRAECEALDEELEKLRMKWPSVPMIAS